MTSMTMDQPPVFPAGKSALARLIPVFSRLVEAFDYSEDAHVSALQFGIELDSLWPLGLTLSDLRWLLTKKLADMVDETTLPGAQQRSFSPLPATSLTSRACLALTKAGAGVLRSCLREATGEEEMSEAPSGASTVDHCSAKEDEEPSPPQHVALNSPTDSEAGRPTWDPDLRELHFRGQTVKRYQVPAANQELILGVFEEEGWPNWIDDPLPPTAGIDPKRRLQATIKSLNRCQIVPLICFRCNGNGHRVVWASRTE